MEGRSHGLERRRTTGGFSRVLRVFAIWWSCRLRKVLSSRSKDIVFDVARILADIIEGRADLRSPVLLKKVYRKLGLQRKRARSRRCSYVLN